MSAEEAAQFDNRYQSFMLRFLVCKVHYSNGKIIKENKTKPVINVCFILTLKRTIPQHSVEAYDPVTLR